MPVLSQPVSVKEREGRMPILLLQLVRACVTEYSHPAPPFCPVRCEKIANRSTRCPVPASRTWQWRTSSWLVAKPDKFRPITSNGLVADCRVSSKCDVHKPWKTIVGFALLGLAIAGACYAHAAFYDYTK